MDDRLAMWRVAAVADSFVDMETIGRVEWQAILDEVASRMKAPDTPPTFFTIFRFALWQ